MLTMPELGYDQIAQTTSPSVASDVTASRA